MKREVGVYSRPVLGTLAVSAPAVIATSGLTKDFGAGRGLFGLDLEIHQGEVFGFLGPNGKVPTCRTFFRAT